LVLRPIALEVLETLRRHVREHDIKLRGEIDGKGPADIDVADCIEGELSVFERTLKVYARPQDIKPLREYTRMFCVKDDVMRIVNSVSKNRSPTTPITLEVAPELTIRYAIKSVYDDADKGGLRPPNINELPIAVRPRIEKLGYRLPSGNQIKRIGREKEFACRRGKVGKRRT
jgi:hypothetical protein